MSWRTGGRSCCFAGPWSWGCDPGGPWSLPTHPSARLSPRSSGRMRRAGLGEGVPPGNYGNYGYPNSGKTACEENERLTESLRNKVTAIKSLSTEIGHEVKHQNKLLAEMDSQFDSTTGFLGKTMGKLKILSRGSQTMLLCYMMLFSFFVFFVIYWIIKLRWCKSVWVWNLFQLNSLEYHISKKKKKNQHQNIPKFQLLWLFPSESTESCFINHTR